MNSHTCITFTLFYLWIISHLSWWLNGYGTLLLRNEVAGLIPSCGGYILMGVNCRNDHVIES